ncbi:MAG: DEAD/DEAH box helicase [Candidatus Eisenbacteria bacterium]|uniref:RNA helicase n=1 Tax=Eiseniibacteriota bacterium TaxID=2212470 RepID=A0A956LY29_UNCEI|nr:DEAD/DEAH box helicase [Candidatus Eisenbacteria bacterium]
MSFQNLNLSPALCRTLERCGYDRPTPVQAKAIPVILDGADLVASAQTGTGKTAAFALPILQMLGSDRAERTRAGRPRVLVLTPTRELAMQVQESFRKYGQASSPRSLAIFGGASMVPQTQGLRRGVEIVVATPGRLLDHLGQNNLTLSGVEILVLDEADRMLDMGFLPDLERILSALPERRQSLLFSATFPPPIRELAAKLLRNPVEVKVAPPNSVAPRVSHALYRVEREGKRDRLVGLLGTEGAGQALVFCRTRHGSDRLCRQLSREGFAAAAIHGDKSQNARVRALRAFKSGQVSVLVATDVAARGLDIPQLPLVVNYDLPSVAEDYIHRIGRTGRAGETGRAVSLVSSAERDQLQAIEQLLGRAIEEGETGSGSRVPAAVPVVPPRRTVEDNIRDGAARASDRPRARHASSDRAQGVGRSERGRNPRPRHTAGAENPNRNETKRNDSRRDDSRRSDVRRTDVRRSDARRDDSRRNDARRTDSRGSDARRTDVGRNGDVRRNDARRDDSRRSDVRRSDPRRDDSRRNARGGRDERKRVQPAAAMNGSDRPRNRRGSERREPVREERRYDGGPGSRRPFWWPFAFNKKKDGPQVEPRSQRRRRPSKVRETDYIELP